MFPYPLPAECAQRWEDHEVADTESLRLALQRRGYHCAVGSSVEGSVCVIQSGPNGNFDPPVEIRLRLPRYPDNGGIEWRAGGVVRRATLDEDTEALRDQIIESISGDLTAW